MKTLQFKNLIACIVLFLAALAGTAQTNDSSAQPAYPGGQDALIKDLSEHLAYPLAEEKAGKEGRLYLTFLVETDGSIHDIKVVRGVADAPGFDQAAIDAVSKLKKFNPALKGGVPVSSTMTLPVTFSLKK
jgi:periplasmic protein TonB